MFGGFDSPGRLKSLNNWANFYPTSNCFFYPLVRIRKILKFENLVRLSLNKSIAILCVLPVRNFTINFKTKLFGNDFCKKDF